MPVMSFSPTWIGEIDVGRVLGWQMVPRLPVGVVSLKGLIRREGGAMLGVEGMAMLGVVGMVEPLIVASGAWNREERLISGVTESWWLRNPVVCWSCSGKTVWPLLPGPWRAGLGSGGGFGLEGNPLVDRELS